MALSVAHRGYVMETGKIVATGSGAELIESPEIKRAYLGGLTGAPGQRKEPPVL